MVLICCYPQFFIRQIICVKSIYNVDLLFKGKELTFCVFQFQLSCLNGKLIKMMRSIRCIKAQPFPFAHSPNGDRNPPVHTDGHRDDTFLTGCVNRDFYLSVPKPVTPFGLDLSSRFTHSLEVFSLSCVITGRRKVRNRRKVHY